MRVASSPTLDGYLTDALGRPLYMYTRDVPGAPDSACTAACAQQWPPFDMAVVSVEPSLDAAEVTRFHRTDGAYQTSYKGHPLYYRAAELNTREVTADGFELRWFVARDYLLALAPARSFAPLGGMAGDGQYLTDGYGRALYVCLDDIPGTAEQLPTSTCDGSCLADRPIFGVAETERTTRLPSVLAPAALSELPRPDGTLQLTYRGWPLYYFTGDRSAGAAAGHNERAWRVIDPSAFGREPQSD